MSSSPVLTGAETAQPKLDILSEVGLTPFEGARVRELVGREPNALEWAMFGAMWSEHCAYKHSKKLLRTLPTKGARVALGPGDNAGAVDLGDGLLCAFKVESHNHPSAVEPYQGAATGRAPIAKTSRRIPPTPVAAPWYGSTAEGWLWLSTLKAQRRPSPRSTAPAFSPGPSATRAPFVGSVRSSFFECL